MNGKQGLERNRGGFTLTELLVVISIIAVLAGLAIPAVMMANVRAYEFRISTKVSQYDSAVESFRNEKGLYPPDQYYDQNGSFIVWLDPSASEAALLTALVQRYGPLLQKIAPNHREFQATPATFAGTDYPIIAWYRQRGQFLNPTNALSFWLGGGLSNSSVYPLSETCRRANELPVTNAAANTLYLTRTGLIKPLVYTEFPTTSVDPLAYWSGGAGAPSWSAGAQRGDQFYFQGEVPRFLRSQAQESTNRPLLYFIDIKGATTANTLFAPYYDPATGWIKTINIPGEANPMTPIGYGTMPALTLFAPDKFQLIAPGRDDLYGGGGIIQHMRDNICNFANSGRLDSMPEAENLGL